MTTAIAPSTITRPGAHVERRAGSMTEKIWHETDDLVHQGIQQAAHHLHIKTGERPGPREALDLAYTMQRRKLAQSDTDEWTTSKLTTERAALLLIEVPAAAEATQTRQETTSRTRRAEAIATLSQFNQDLAATFAYMPPSMLESFQGRFLAHSERTLEGQLGLPVLDRDEFGRIVGGIKREVRVWRALQAEAPDDWEVRPATVKEDLAGTDLVIHNEHDQELRLDVKAPGGFDKTIERLRESRRLSPDAAQTAAENGYLSQVERMPDGREVLHCIFDADHIGGESEGFEFKDPLAIMEFAKARFESQPSPTLRRLGERAIVT